MPMSNALSLANFKAPLKGILKPWDFDLDEITFTASMAKRATGVFATAPIVQGNWAGGPTPDAITFPRGALLGNLAQEWYGNLDPYQGSIVLWITPEWDGDDGKSHYFIAGGSGMIFGLSLYKNSSDELVLQSDMTELETVDISAWAAGTTYCVIASWDTKNTIDGTNYARISINNIHSYDQASTFTPTTNTTIRIGSAFTAGIQTSPANALIEGLTIYRRVLWDGTYGKDVGNGIETTLIYAAGVGEDPCLITGSWDVVFCVPTDSTAGALVTGPGEAWSHPHGGALPEHAFADDGGYFSEPWAVFYDGADTDIDCGSGASLDDLPNLANGVQMEIWCRADDWGEANTAHFLSKYVGDLSGGWNWGLDSANGLWAFVFNLTTDSYTVTGTDDFTPDGKWHHFLFSFHHVDQGGDSKIYMAIDGVWVAAYTTQTAGVGAFQSDAAVNFHIGNSSPAPSHTQEGCVGWVAVWNDVTQYVVGTDFVPTRTAPAAGGNLQESWHLDEGTGVTVAAEVTTPGNDGTIANIGAWERQWEVETTPVMPQSWENDGAASGITVTDAANIQNLHAAAMTVEGCFRIDSLPGEVMLIEKAAFAAGWLLFVISDGGIQFRVNAATNSVANAPVGTWSADGVFHHIRATFDMGGDRLARIYFDGLLVGTAGVAAVGPVDTDVGADIEIASYGLASRFLDGAVGWVRVSDVLRTPTIDSYFTPPARSNPPANDAGAELLLPFTDGAGVTVTDNSGNGYNGTITPGAGRWDNTYDMELDSPGARTFQNGYVFGFNGVGDGAGHQFVVTAETDHVVRFLGSPGQDGRGLNNLYLWDVTNGAQIGANYQMPSYHGAHTGGAASPTLDDNTARWPQGLGTIMAYNITQGTSGAVTAIDGGMQSLTAGINWNNGDEYRLFWADGYHKHPWTEPMVFRTPAGCVLVDIRLLSLDGEGTLYVHQVEVQESALSNGWLETWQGLNPDVPVGWVQTGLDPGDTQTSSTGGGVIHSGSEAAQWNVGAVAGETLRVDAAGEAVGDFVAIGFWNYGDGATFTQLRTVAANAHLQHSLVAREIAGPVAAVWSHVAGVWRTLVSIRLFLNAAAGAGGPRYSDDYYVIILDPVTLTVTPTSEANSAESSGIRIDGYDTGTQPIPAGAIRANRGLARWTWRPRHTAALLAGFGNTTAPTLLHAWGNATNYIHVYATAANNIRLEFNDGGGVHQANWNCAGLIAVDTAYVMEVRWNPGRMQLYQDGTMRAEIVQPVSFVTIPTIAYWGSQQAGDEQIDAVFGAP